jgi:hypothetical protein
MAVGNVTLKREGDRQVTLNFGVNTMCRLEAIDGRTHREVLREMQGGAPRMTTIRALVQAAVVEPQGITAEEAGAIIEEIGGPSVIVMAFSTSLEEIDAVGVRIEALSQTDASARPTRQRTTRRAKG